MTNKSTLKNSSAIAEGHFYTMIVFQSDKIDSLSDIVKSFSLENNHEIIELDDEFSFVHIHLTLNKLYGLESVLSRNLVKDRLDKNGNPYYFYDLYSGMIKLNSSDVVFLCFPYKALEVDRKNLFKETFIGVEYYQPDLKKVIDQAKKGVDKDVLSKIIMDAEISKYNLLVDEYVEGQKKMQISGENPIRSKIYSMLLKMQQTYKSLARLYEKGSLGKNRLDELEKNKIDVIPISLRIDFTEKTIYNLSITLDILGNYRFWIKQGELETTVRLLPKVLKYVDDLNCLNKTTNISAYSTNDD